MLEVCVSVPGRRVTLRKAKDPLPINTHLHTRALAHANVSAHACVSVPIHACVHKPRPSLGNSSVSFARQFLCLFLCPILIVAIYLMINFSLQSVTLYCGFLPLSFIGIMSPVNMLLRTIFHCQDSVL